MNKPSTHLFHSKAWSLLSGFRNLGRKAQSTWAQGRPPHLDPRFGSINLFKAKTSLPYYQRHTEGKYRHQTDLHHRCKNKEAKRSHSAFLKICELQNPGSPWPIAWFAYFIKKTLPSAPKCSLCSLLWTKTVLSDWIMYLSPTLGQHGLTRLGEVYLWKFHSRKLGLIKPVNRYARVHLYQHLHQTWVLWKLLSKFQFQCEIFTIIRSARLTWRIWHISPIYRSSSPVESIDLSLWW